METSSVEISYVGDPLYYDNMSVILMTNIFSVCLPVSFSVPRHRLSPSVIFFFPISKFSYELIRFLLHSFVVKSDKEIGKFS